ncbi:MAG: hypothetical protein IPJ16_00050 [Bacteroidales bacterium]|nr:hypothetical protein [Bacteroidales bacterium]
MNKEKLIFFGAIGVVILIMVIYGVSVYSKKDPSAGSAAADFTVPDLVEKDLAKEEYNNRLKKANSYQEPEVKQDLSKTADFKTYQSEPRKDVEMKSNTEDQVRMPVPQKQEPIKVKEKILAETRSVAPQKKEEDTGGFGIIVSERSSGKKSAHGSQAKNDGFTAAMLEEDTKIKNQSSVVFFLLEDLSIDGKVLRKTPSFMGKLQNLEMFSI